MLSPNSLLKGLRIGSGFDIHAFAPNRRLIIGGEELSYLRDGVPYGLLGHSDADVLTHALMDALLGSIGERDIGYHFPPSDFRFRDANSLELLRQVMVLLSERRAEIINCDLTLMLEAPKVSSATSQMRENLSKVMALDVTKVAIKATTFEGLGSIGRGDGVIAQAVVLVHINYE
jgi:2-C-methyl-D-erythritol 2,4-cyclodiphosphate synthase